MSKTADICGVCLFVFFVFFGGGGGYRNLSLAGNIRRLIPVPFSYEIQLSNHLWFTVNQGIMTLLHKHAWINNYIPQSHLTWWLHHMETFSIILALCEGNPPVISGFPSQRPVTCFDVFFDLCLNKRLSKQSIHQWFETPSCSLWCHCNDFGFNQFLTVSIFFCSERIKFQQI